MNSDTPYQKTGGGRGRNIEYYGYFIEPSTESTCYLFYQLLDAFWLHYCLMQALSILWAFIIGL